jgi:lipopolysaccharide/colanic/teichoic acid biosynthesis glycosyltransferase
LDAPGGYVCGRGMAGLESTKQTTRTVTPRPPRGPVARPPRTAARTVKHALDRLTAACGLIVTAPLMAAVALALRLRGDGRVIVRAQRLGEGGRLIVVRSFAVTDAMCARSRAWRLVRGMGMTVLPQLWSVLRGEMSVIGPRPRDLSLDPPPARPGLTGLAQLAQLDHWLSVGEQLDLDDEYAHSWSLVLDARIVWRTMWCVLR